MDICITRLGAIGDGAHDNSEVIRGAIRQIRESGGGRITIPAGNFVTGPLELVSNLQLHLEPGATLLFSDQFADYPPTFTRWEGVECYGYHPLVYGRDLYNVSITGRGILDGRGEGWWKERRRRQRERILQPQKVLDIRLAALNPGYESAGGGGGGRESQFLRPPLIQFLGCENVLIDGVTCRNSPFWNTHLVYCHNAHVRDVTFFNPDGAPNGDGIDIDSCHGVSLTGCTFDMGDDCIVIKSGCDADGRRVNRPCEDIVISNCLLLRGHGGVVFGSESAAGIRNVSVTNCIFRGTDRGVRFKSRRGRGGVTEDIRVSNCIMQNVRCPVVMNLKYVCGIPASERDSHGAFSYEAAPVDEATPGLRNIHFADITARNTEAAAAVLIGLPERPIEHVTFDNIAFTLDPNAEPKNPAMAYGVGSMNRTGIVGRNIRRLSLRNATIEGVAGPLLQLRQVEGLTMLNVHGEPFGSDATVEMIECSAVRASQCRLANVPTHD